MRAPISSGLTFLAGAALVAGCGARVPNGARPATAADRASPGAARYVCGGPSGLMVDASSKVKQIEGEGGDLLIVAGGAGPIAVSGREATTNHWQAPDGDHFFSWYPSSDLGTETIVHPSRTRALSLFWAAQPTDPGAYVTRSFPDGTTRPSGTPTEIFSCLERGAFEAQRARSGLGFPFIDTVPGPASQVGPHATLRVLGCQRKGGKDDIVALQNVLPDWGWVPFEIFVPVGGQPMAYLSFERLPFGKTPVWTVLLASSEFSVQVGQVKLDGLVFEKNGKPSAQIIGTVPDQPELKLDCVYEAR
jgi:hypothetical protein